MRAALALGVAAIASLAGCAGGDRGARSTRIDQYAFASLPEIGRTTSGVTLKLGGFSGLIFEGRDPVSGRLRFLTHTDRGPNLDSFMVIERMMRPFALPQFSPELVRLEVDSVAGKALIVARIPITQPDGKPLTGLPPSNPLVGRLRFESPIDLEGVPLSSDPEGLDLEGITRAPDGTLWMADEYGPSLVQLNGNGRVVKRVDASRFCTLLARRELNRGFEAITFTSSGRILVFLESIPGLPDSLRRTLALEYDPSRDVATGLYVYEFANDGAVKIGDAALVPDRKRIVVIEQNSLVGPGAVHKLYEIDLDRSDNLIAIAPDLTAERIAVARTIGKTLRADLSALGYDRRKVEGVAFIDRRTAALLDDNDFGIRGEVLPSGGIRIVENHEEPMLGIVRNFRF